MYRQVVKYVAGGCLLLAAMGAAAGRVPPNRAEEVGVPVKLAFTHDGNVPENSGFVIFIGTDRQEVQNAFYRNHANVDVVELETNELELPDLKTATTYFWRVDLFNDQKEPLETGAVWSFTTAKTAGEVFVLHTGVDHDLLADGVGNTGFDGLIGKGPGETADRMEIDGGQLHLESARGRYEGDARPLGPLVYKTVNGDFQATVRVAGYQDIAYNNGGLMVRAANLDDAGEGEDWISLDYFPIYDGIYSRMTDRHQRKEVCSNGQGRKADRWLQIEMIGNMFYQRHSADGENWVDMPCSPIERSDLVNIPLQVGLFQATYSDNRGHVAFDNFRLQMNAAIKTARLHSPEDGAQDVPTTWRLSWIPGSGADHHDIYLGTTREAVEAGNSKMAKGGTVYQGRQDVRDTQLDFSDLEDGKTYYWRIDEVTDGEITRGDIWSFAVYNRALVDFRQYASMDALAEDWKSKGSGRAALVDGEDGKSVALSYDISAAPHFSMLEHTFAADQNWFNSLYGFRCLSVTFKGEPNNGAAPLLMVFDDDSWGTHRTVVPYSGDPQNLRNPTWTRWDIDLQELVRNNPAFRLTHVKKMAISVGNPDHPSSAGEKGTLTFAGIKIDSQRKDPTTGKVWPEYFDPDRFLSPVPYRDVKVTGGLWKERMDVNRTSSLPHVWGRCETSVRANGDPSLRLDNFRVAAGEKSGGFTGIYFNDSDVYKLIEGTAYSLHNHPDPKLAAYTDKVIDSIAKAQWDDGYLYTFYSLPEHQPQNRFTHVGGMHELYCAGHLIEAGIAYDNATGKRKLLDVAIKFADLICDTFGPGKKMDPPGHQEIELALMRLYEATGNTKYMDTAKFFIDARGIASNGRNLYGTYSQDHVPFIEQEEGVGHSVRAGYMYSGATDVVRVNHDEAYANALMRVWDNIVNKKTYITGGIGQPGGPEGFAGDYELSNNCYAETCSGIAFAMWNHRLHELTGEGKYMDIAERTLLNNVLSALSQEGDKHYYTNPLTTNGRERWEWPGHDCACCPPNLVRAIASIGGYAYSYADGEIFVDMYMPNQATVPIPDNPVAIVQETAYPWDGNIKLTLKPGKSAAFALKLRIPGWALNEPMPGNLYSYLDENTEPVVLKVNREQVGVDIKDGYATLNRKWKAGDVVELSLPMKVRRVVTHPKATMNRGLVALERGPIVYCAEFKDNDFPVEKLDIPDDAQFNATFEEALFNGAVTLESSNGVKLIPCYLYANRGPGWMRIWMPTK